MTPSQARNAIKKCLKTVVDPKPSPADVDQLWAWFDSRCAYCGQLMERASRQAHKDHLIAESEGGTNRLGNLVLSCGHCNGDEKRELDWEEFLAAKCNDDHTLNARRESIERWIASHDGATRLPREHQDRVEAAFDRINTVLTECLEELRQHVRSTTD